MATSAHRDENEFTVNMDFLRDIDPRVAIIVCNVESNSISAIMNELMDDISLPILEESREVMFKQATLRYNDMLNDEAEYNALGEVPILVIKNRRKGDMQLQKTAKDLVDLVIFSAGLIDIFPKDTLSSNTSKFIDLGSVVPYINFKWRWV